MTATTKVNFVKTLGYPRGWHRRKTFEISIDGTKHFYIRGVEVSEIEFITGTDVPPEGL